VEARGEGVIWQNSLHEFLCGVSSSASKMHGALPDAKIDSVDLDQRKALDRSERFFLAPVVRGFQGRPNSFLPDIAVLHRVSFEPGRPAFRVAGEYKPRWLALEEAVWGQHLSSLAIIAATNLTNGISIGGRGYSHGGLAAHKSAHRIAVVNGIRLGLPVPPEVRKEYDGDHDGNIKLNISDEVLFSLLTDKWFDEIFKSLHQSFPGP
jgi:hypothetical protein